MKVAIPTDGNTVSDHFGRCPSFTLFEVEDNSLVSKETIENPGHHPGFLPKFLNEKGANLIIAGGLGPKAKDLFDENNISQILGIQGNIDAVITKFIDGSLIGGESSCTSGGGKGYGHDKSECDHEGHHHHHE